MSQKVFSLTAGAVFLLIALGHILRVVFGLAFVVSRDSCTDVGQRARCDLHGLSCLRRLSTRAEIDATAVSLWGSGHVVRAVPAGHGSGERYEPL